MPLPHIELNEQVNDFRQRCLQRHLGAEETARAYTDCGFAGGPNWRAIVRERRAKWRRIQTLGAVRDAPATAATALRAMGYTVRRPADGEPPERIETLMGW